VLRGSTAEGLTFEHPRAEASEASCSTLGETDAPTEYRASTRESTVVEEKSRVNPHEQNGTRNGLTFWVHPRIEAGEASRRPFGATKG